MTSQLYVKVSLLYSCLNEIVTFPWYRSQYLTNHHQTWLFEIAITPSIFELERRTKSQNVGNGITYLGVGLNFRFNFRFKCSPDIKWRPFWKFRNILDRFILTSDLEKPATINLKKSTFDVNDVTDDVIAWRQKRMDTGDGHRFSLLVKMPVHAILLIFKQVKHQYNLQHFNYHYHHYNQHCNSKFWQVRNLRLPFHWFVWIYRVSHKTVNPYYLA